MIKFVSAARGRIAKIIADEGNLPYSTVRKLLRDKDIKLNGKRIKEDITCEIGDLIEVYYSEEKVKPTLNIIFKDENILLLNKPSGITSENLFEKVVAEYPTAIAVHRLDRNTRGLIIYALNSDAERELTYGFKNRTFEKRYVCEVKGVPEKPSACLTAYLEKDAGSGNVYVHSTRRRGDVEIKTSYRVLKSSGITSVLDVELITGRTHQIRAHLAFMGNPIVGDGKYGDNAFNKKMKANGQRLQAYKLKLSFKNGDKLYYLNDREFVIEKEF